MTSNTQMRPPFFDQIVGFAPSSYGLIVDQNANPQAIIAPQSFLPVLSRELEGLFASINSSSVSGPAQFGCLAPIQSILPRQDLEKQKDKEFAIAKLVETAKDKQESLINKSEVELKNCRNKRKQANPQKSPRAQEPGFKGVLINFKLNVEDNESKLRLEHKYRGLGRRCHRLQKRRARRRLMSGLPYSNSRYKLCSSCGTGKTPLWRDAEDGTPLCNACGIRYKKYRIRCSTCGSIPKKSGKTRIFCACRS